MPIAEQSEQDQEEQEMESADVSDPEPPIYFGNSAVSTLRANLQRSGSYFQLMQSETLLASASQVTPEEQARRTIRHLPYESDSPMVHLMESMSDDFRVDTREKKRRRSVVTQLLDSALETVGVFADSEVTGTDSSDDILGSGNAEDVTVDVTEDQGRDHWTIPSVPGSSPSDTQGLP